MKTQLEGVKIISLWFVKDKRGSFFETFKSTLFEIDGLPSRFLQDNQVRSKQNVLRGYTINLSIHKVSFIQVVLGSIIDVAVDIRVGSTTFGKYHLVNLTSENKKIFYVPEGFTWLLCYVRVFNRAVNANLYDPNDEYGIKWDDPELNIQWGTYIP